MEEDAQNPNNIGNTDVTDNCQSVSDNMVEEQQNNTIQPIDRTSVHRICSGQVVLTLAVAVKELTENSVDAGATSIDIKLKEYGSEVVEVSDNGSGVEQKNFEGLTLKHHTSKLQDFSDLVNVETFGFRGEALSSLCALSNLSVLTCHKDASIGCKLEFDNHGRITNQTPYPRQTGTTVILHNLFHTLPVRHKEFQRNLKKEFAKMVQILNAYCLINTNVRVHCTNQVGKGSRSVVVSTNGNNSIRENIVNIFGSKQLQQLLEFSQYKPSDDICEEFGVKPVDNSKDLFQLDGYVSKCDHGLGRSSTDRQFIFINKRPCDSQKIIKVVNEVYHMYNRHQYPFLVLNIDMEKTSVDVNVTPDKRQIFLQGEKLLLAVIKTSLIKLFEPTTCMLTLNKQMSLNKSYEYNNTSDGHTTKTPNTNVSVLSKLKRSFSSAFSAAESSSSSPKLQKSPKLLKSPKKQKCLDQFVCRTPKSETENSKDLITAVKSFLSPLRDGVTSLDKDDCVKQNSGTSQFSLQPCVSVITSPQNSDLIVGNHCGDSNKEHDLKISEGLQDTQHSNNSESGISENFSLETQSSSSQPSVDDSLLCSSKLESGALNTILDSESAPSVEDCENSLDVSTNCGINVRESCVVLKNHFSHIDCDTDTKEDNNNVSNVQNLLTKWDKAENIKKRERTVKFSFQKLKDSQKLKSEKCKNQSFCRTFRATISPTENQSAEDELKREIKKEMFSQMEILGQFNLGFIITKHGDDLFIVDQHATDEKYNFEMLQKNTVLQSQKLIHPQCLELTASNETILADNLHIFNKNGFEFLINEEDPPTQRVKLVSTPVSKNWNFGKEDIEELIFMLTDSPGIMCRPSRVRMMFASRSCRKAIMIGTALNKSEMSNLVCHMGDIDMPWNCPHGRPTMRHLFNLQMLPRS